MTDVTGFHMSLLRNKLVAASLSAFVELHALTLRKIAHIACIFATLSVGHDGAWSMIWITRLASHTFDAP